jgi:hypothetical protein
MGKWRNDGSCIPRASASAGSHLPRARSEIPQSGAGAEESQPVPIEGALRPALAALEGEGGPGAGRRGARRRQDHRGRKAGERHASPPPSKGPADPPPSPSIPTPSAHARPPRRAAGPEIPPMARAWAGRCRSRWRRCGALPRARAPHLRPAAARHCPIRAAPSSHSRWLIPWLWPPGRPPGPPGLPVRCLRLSSSGSHRLAVGGVGRVLATVWSRV